MSAIRLCPGVEAGHPFRHSPKLVPLSLVGLDREAAKAAFAAFIDGRPATANQVEFLSLMISHLTQHRAMEPGLLYESPSTDIRAHGPEGVFTPGQVDGRLEILKEIRTHAMA